MRIGSWSGELNIAPTPPETHNGLNGICNGRLRGGLGWEMANTNGSSTQCVIQFPSSTYTPDSGQGRSVYATMVNMRGYIYIESLPVTEQRLFGGDGSIEGIDSAWYTTIDSVGIIRAYNQGNGPQVNVGITAAALQLTTWYRVNISFYFASSTPNPNPPPSDIYGPGSLSVAVYTLADTLVAACGGSCGTTGNRTGLGNTSQHASTIRCGPNGSLQNPATNGADIIFDDVVVEVGNGLSIPNTPYDLPQAIGAGGITLLHITGQGTDNGWVTGGNWRALQKSNPDDPQGAAPTELTNTTLGAATSFTVESMASKGLAGRSIKAIRVIFRGQLAAVTGAAMTARFTGGGGVSTTPITFTAANSWIDGLTPDTVQSGHGWFMAFTPALTGEILEIGVIDRSAGAGTSELHGGYVLVDWEGPDPVYPADNNDIQIVTGSFTGNGTWQDVAFADPTFKPTLLIVRGELTGVVSNEAIWCRWWNEDGNQSLQAGSASFTGCTKTGLTRVFTGGFTVQGGTSGVNVAATTFHYCAVRDNLRRLVDGGIRGFATVGSPDNITIKTNHPTFGPNPGFAGNVFLVWGVNSSVAGSLAYRDDTFVGDSSIFLDTLASAGSDRIQSQGLGAFQIGTTLTTNYTAWIGLANNGFKVNKLFAYGQYTGDGTNGRVIDASGQIGSAGAMMLIMPMNSDERFVKFYNDGSGTTARRWDTGQARTGVFSFDTPGQFTVSVGVGSANSNGIVYHWFIFGSGTDPVIVPEIPIPTTPGYIGLTWVEFTDSSGNLSVWSQFALPDPPSYYGGYKEPRVTTWGVIRRALSDDLGQYSGADFNFTLDDTDRRIRGLLAGASTQFFPNRNVVVRTIDDASRRLLKTPRTIMRGFIDLYKPAQDLHFDFTVRDALASKFSLQNAQDQVPQRLITLADFPHANDTFIPQSVQSASSGQAQPGTPIAAVGLPVPIIYGEITDTQLISVPGPQGGFDSTIPAVLAIGQTGAGSPGDLGGQGAGGRNSYVTCVRGGKEGPLGAEGGNRLPSPDDPLQNAGPAGVRVNWNQVPGVDSYRIYVFGPNAAGFNPLVGLSTLPTGAFCRVFTHDNVTIDGFLNSPPDGWSEGFNIVCNSYTSGVGPVSGAPSTPGSVAYTAPFNTTNVLVDAGDGQCPVIYVGDQTVGGILYRKFLVAGHACKSCDEVYINNDPQNIKTDATQSGAGGVWLIPGYPGWTTAFGNSNLFEDINGNRYYCVYGKAGFYGPDTGCGIKPPRDSGSVPMGLSIKGIETNGDGTGTLILDLPLQYLHALQNWVLGNYKSGPWLLSPLYPVPLTYAAAVQLNTPVGYWRLGETGGTIANDSSLPAPPGGSAPGIYNGGVTLGQLGPLSDGDLAATFDGATGYVDMGTAAALDVLTGLSLECWVNMTATTGVLMSRSDSAGATTQYLLNIVAGSPIFTVGKIGTTVAVNASTTVNDGQWHHVVGTWDGTTARIYVDAVFKNSGAFTGPLQDSGLPFRLGQYSNGGTFFAGTMDEPAVYGAALVPAQIISHFQLRTAAANTNEPAVAMIDETSFATVNTLAHARVPGGYRGDFIVGATALGAQNAKVGGLSERIAVRDFCAQLNVSCDVNSGFNRKAQFFISMVDDSATTVSGAATLTDVSDIHQGTFDITDDLQHQYNVVPYLHTKDYFLREPAGWRSIETSVLEVSDQLSVMLYAPPGQGPYRLPSPTQQYAMIRGLNRASDYTGYAQGTATAADVVGRYLLRHKNPPRLVTFQVGFSGVNVDLGDVVRVSHYAGIGLAGWTNRPLRIIRHETDPGKYTVDLQLLDLQPFFDTVFIFGDETALPASWLAATAANRLYGYLADDTTGRFDTGDIGKRLR